MSVKKNTIYNLAGSLVPLLVALATIPLYLQVIGMERYGALAIAWVVLGYFGMFDLGLGPATAQRIAKLHDSTADHRARVFWTSVVVNMAVGLLGAGLLFAGARYFFLYEFEADPALIAEMVEALPWLALAVPVATLSGVARGALQGRDKFLDANAVTAFGTILFQLLPLIVAFAVGPEMPGLIIAALVARLIALLLAFARVWQHLLRGMPARFDKGEWLPLLRFGGWVSITTMVGPMLVAADRILIGALLSAAAVATYAVAFDVARRLSLVPNAFGVASFPQFAQRDAAANDLLMNRSMGALALLLTAPVVGCLFLAEPLLSLWLGRELGTQATDVTRILLIAYWGNAFAVVPFVRIQAQGRPDIVTWSTLAQAPILLLALYLSIRDYGIAGAAFVVAARCNIEVLVLLYLVNAKAALPRFFLAGIAVMAAGYLLATLVPALSWTWLVVTPTMMLLAFAATWQLVPEESRKDFKSLLIRLLHAARLRHR